MKKNDIKQGDKVVILRGLWQGSIVPVTHVSENKRWVFINYYNKSRYYWRNVEKYKEVGE